MTGSTTFSNPQHQQKIEELVSIAKEQGYLTYEEINEILPMTFDSPEQIDQVLIYLSGMDIQVLNQSEVDRQRRPTGNIFSKAERSGLLGSYQTSHFSLALILKAVRAAGSFQK